MSNEFLDAITAKIGFVKEHLEMAKNNARKFEKSIELDTSIIRLIGEGRICANCGGPNSTEDCICKYRKAK